MTDCFPQVALRVRSPPAPAAEAQERTAFAQQPAPSRSARPRGASPALQLHGRVAKLYSIDDAVARQKEAQGPRGVCWPWCSAVGFLGPHHDFAAWTRRALQGRHLRSQRSLQLQEVDVFLHPPGVRVCADLPPLPGDEHNCCLWAFAAGVEIILHMILGQLPYTIVEAAHGCISPKRR